MRFYVGQKVRVAAYYSNEVGMTGRVISRYNHASRGGTYVVEMEDWRSYGRPYPHLSFNGDELMPAWPKGVDVEVAR